MIEFKVTKYGDDVYDVSLTRDGAWQLANTVALIAGPIILYRVLKKG